MALLKYWFSTYIVLLDTFCGFTQHSLNSTSARHLLHFLAQHLKFAWHQLFAQHLNTYSAHTRFCIFSALIENSTWHEVTCLAPTNKFSWLSSSVALTACPPSSSISLSLLTHCANAISSLWSLNQIKVSMLCSSLLCLRVFETLHSLPHF